MKTKTLIERNLPFSGRYIYMSITRGSIESGQLTCCDNCGKLITNMVHVTEKATLKQYVIGTECAETLSKAKCLYNNGDRTGYYCDIYRYNTCAKVATELRKGKEFEIDGWLIRVKTDKGKEITCFESAFKEFFPELIELHNH